MGWPALTLASLVPVLMAALPVQLQLDRCAQVSNAEVERLLFIELKSGAHPVEPSGRVVVACEAERLVVWYFTSSGELRDSRRLEWGQVTPSARERLLALSISELLSQPPRVAAEGPSLKPAPPAPSASSTPPSPRPPWLGVWPFAAARLLGSLRTFGGGLEVTGRLGSFLWLAGLGGEFANQEASPGRVQARMLTGTVGLGWGVGNTWRLEVAAGVQGGQVWLQGEAAASSGVVGQLVQGPWLGPFARLTPSWAPVRSLAIRLTVEAGVVVRPVVGALPNGDARAVRGPWGALGVGIGWQP